MKAHQFLEAAAGHMKDRAATYDKPEGERSMPKAVAAFEAVTCIKITPEQGWLFMALLKAVRTQQGGYRADNYEDGAAYFALAGEQAATDRSEWQDKDLPSSGLYDEKPAKDENSRVVDCGVFDPQDGGPAYHLFMRDACGHKMTWGEASELVKVEGSRGWFLPSVTDLQHCRRIAPNEFSNSYYWADEDWSDTVVATVVDGIYGFVANARKDGAAKARLKLVMRVYE